MILDDILRRFSGVTRAGSGWQAYCPVHEANGNGHRQSLSIDQGDAGKVLIHCHAGCDFAKIISAAGLSMSDLMPATNGNGHVSNNRVKEKSKGPMMLGVTKQAVAMRLIDILSKRYGQGVKLAHSWDYGTFTVLRFDLPTPAGEKQRKEFRPIHLAPLGNQGAMAWHLGYPPQLPVRPLYGLPQIEASADTSMIAVLGGEKCTDAATAIGLLATCNAGGEKAVDKTDWSPLLRFSSVVVLVDNDEAGEKFGDAVPMKLKSLRPDLVVKVIRLPGLPPKGDIVEWIEAHGDTAEPETMRAELAALIAAAPEWRPTAETLEHKTAKVKSAATVVAPGTKVRALDRDNYGEVLSDNGETCTVHFVSPDGQAADVDLRKSQLRTQDGKPLVATDEPPKFVNVMTTRDFLLMDLRQTYLIDRVTVQGQQGTIGGRSKCCKTLVAIDMALSVASGTPFLGHFHVPQAAPVIFLSYESGGATLQRTFDLMARSRGLTPDDTASLPIYWQFEDRICLSDPWHIDAAADLVKRLGAKLLIDDPLYLTLFGPGDVPKSGDLFYMGQRLAGLGELCHSTGVAAYVLHHFRKSAIQDNDEPAGLDELSMSGLGEFVRQWVLLQRRQPYANDGRHELWARIGGSAGHSGLYGLTIEEGTGEHSGRTWRTEVQSVTDARAEARRLRDNRKAAEMEEREGEHRRRLLEVLQRFRDGETSRALRIAAGLNPDNFGKAITALLKEGRATACEVVKGKRTHEGYQPCNV